jgi:hypothetical protein
VLAAMRPAGLGSACSREHSHKRVTLRVARPLRPRELRSTPVLHAGRHLLETLLRGLETGLQHLTPRSLSILLWVFVGAIAALGFGTSQHAVGATVLVPVVVLFAILAAGATYTSLWTSLHDRPSTALLLSVAIGLFLAVLLFLSLLVRALGG